jgi:hypothetical protein
MSAARSEGAIKNFFSGNSSPFEEENRIDCLVGVRNRDLLIKAREVEAKLTNISKQLREMNELQFLLLVAIFYQRILNFNYSENMLLIKS